MLVADAFADVPSWFSVFRDAVYGQNVSIDGAEKLYLEADARARENLKSSDLYTMLSKCEYLLGRVYQDNGRDIEAASHFEKGISWAEKSLGEKEGAEIAKAGAYEMIASNYGQLCMIKSRAWVMVNGLKVEENAKKALRYDGNNAGSLYLLASRWAFGPGVFGDPKRGITELEAILNGGAVLQKDDYFNIYSALSYALNRLNRNQEALPFIQKSLALYPTNKFALDLQSQIEQKLRTTK